jgi:flagellar biosynthesis/type III secretory pathway M-ring protein FliF/YscJ
VLQKKTRMSKEMVLLIALLSIVIIGIVYWYYVQKREYKSLIERLKQVPMVCAILVFLGIDDK